jgi:glycerophosphoryl diester phosphodiesterase
MKVSLFPIALLIAAVQYYPLMGQQPHSKLIVIAHRGDHTDAPENTLKAFQDGATTGVDYVEVDVRTSSDGKLVVMHDATVDRMTDGKGNVKDLTWPALQQLNVRDTNRPELGTHRVPLFADVLKACKGRVGIYLDFKDGDIAQTWQLIKANHMEEHVVVYINREEDIPGWKKIAPKLPLMVSLPDSVRDIQSYRRFQMLAKAQIIDGNYRDYTPELVKAINKNGEVIWVDVQEKNEDPILWNKVLALGVQGMQTDHPRELVRWRDTK